MLFGVGWSCIKNTVKSKCTQHSSPLNITAQPLACSEHLHWLQWDGIICHRALGTEVQACGLGRGLVSRGYRAAVEDTLVHLCHSPSRTAKRGALRGLAAPPTPARAWPGIHGAAGAAGQESPPVHRSPRARGKCTLACPPVSSPAIVPEPVP